MSNGNLIQFVRGALAALSWVAGLYFLRFWRVSRDRFFVYFVVAFWTLTLNWIWLMAANPSVETRHYAFVIRLIAFTAIIVGILDKNRTGARH